MNEFYYKEEVKLLETENLILKKKIDDLEKEIETLKFVVGGSDEKRIRNQN
jgi:hypothetical protein